MKKFRSNKGFTLIELLIVVAIIGIIAAIAIPGLLRARMSGNEASAIGSLRAINSAQASFSTSCVPNGYAVSLADLAKAPAGGQGFISPDLNINGVVKSGYSVALAGDATAGVIDISVTNACMTLAATPRSSYFANANPTAINGTGTRYFATDSRGTIWQNTAAALPNPLPLVATGTVRPVQ